MYTDRVLFYYAAFRRFFAKDRDRDRDKKRKE